MRQYTYQNTASGTPTLGGSETIEIDKTGYISEINCLFKIPVATAAATVAPESKFPDDVARLIKSARLYSGSTTYWAVDDGREWFWDNFFHYKGKNLPYIIANDGTNSYGPAQPFGTAATTYYLPLTIHLGNQHYNPYDPTCPIPARELTQLNLEINYNDQAEFDTNATATFALGTCELTISINELQLEAGETREKIWPAGLLSPRYEPTTITGETGAHTNLSLKHNCPVGDTLLYSVIVVLDGAVYNRLRSDSLVTEIGIEIPKMREKPWRLNWMDIVANQKRLFGYHMPNYLGVDVASDATHDFGVIFFPWSWISGKPEGLDVSSYLPGDVKMSFTTGSMESSDKILILDAMMG